MRTKKHHFFHDEKGTLVPIEFSTLPFVPQRIFYVYNVPEGMVRGNHAHYKTQQFLICLKGEIVVTLNDGIHDTEIFELQEGHSCFVDKMIWDSQIFMTGKDVLLVLSSTPYDKDDYIFNYFDFKNIVKIKQ